jgi:hypothetical protein
MTATSLAREFDVRVHDVNMSGSNEQQVNDVDVYSADGMLVLTAEVKDKPFSFEFGPRLCDPTLCEQAQGARHDSRSLLGFGTNHPTASISQTLCA